MEALNKAVTNPSSAPLSEFQAMALTKGLSFVPTPKQVPLLDIIASVEHSLTRVERTKAAAIKDAIANTLARHIPRAIPNLTVLEQKSLKEL
ncbi:hypothetical protein M514_21026 [Trichuris suis]|uniref:Uncharacterized protein n=1 Tax=Trichuris suis TaxID=68888 RepID=A0A085NBN6_9BILA|nr:hypothetical protein M514_21026 [Trichuris suis]